MVTRYYNSLRSFLSSLFRPVTNGVLHAILMAYATAFKNFEDDLMAALLQMNVRTSRGFFLKFWGYIYKVKHYGDGLESEESYAKRIVKSVITGRNTGAGIVAMVEELVGSVTVTEYTAGTVIDFDYSTFDYTTHYAGKCFVLKLAYRSLVSADEDDIFFVNSSYTDQAYIANQTNFQMTSDTMVRELVQSAKLAGVKVIYERT